MTRPAVRTAGAADPNLHKSHFPGRRRPGADAQCAPLQRDRSHMTIFSSPTGPKNSHTGNQVMMPNPANFLSVGPPVLGRPQVAPTVEHFDFAAVGADALIGPTHAACGMGHENRTKPGPPHPGYGRRANTVRPYERNVRIPPCRCLRASVDGCPYYLSGFAYGNPLSRRCRQLSQRESQACGRPYDSPLSPLTLLCNAIPQRGRQGRAPQITPPSPL